MTEDRDATIPDEPIEVLVDVEDTELRDETRETSRANLGVYLKEISRIKLLTRAQPLKTSRPKIFFHRGIRDFS